MATNKDFSVRVVVSAVDKVSAQFKAINKSISQSPLAKLNNSLVRLGDSVGVSNVAKSFGNVRKAVGNVASEVGALATKLTVIGGAAAFGTYQIIKSYSDAGDKIAKTAASIGLSTSALQELRFVAERSGVSSDELDTGLVKLSKTIGALKLNQGALNSLLSKNAPKFAQQLKGVKSNEEAFMMLMGAMDKIKDPSVQAALATAAFGRAGVKFINIAKEGEAGIKKLRERFTELGAGIDPVNAKLSEELNDSFFDLGQAMQGVRNIFAQELMPTFIQLTKEFTDLIINNKDDIRQFMVAFAEGVKVAIPQLLALAKSVKEFFFFIDPATQKLTLDMGKIKIVLGAIAAVMVGPLLASVTQLIFAFGGLGKSIALMLGKMFLFIAGSNVTALSLLIKTVSSVGAAFTFLGTAAKAAWLFVTGPVGLVIAAIAALVGLGVLLYKKWEPFRNLIDSIVDGISKIAKSISGTIGRALGFSQPSTQTSTQVMGPQLAPAIGASGAIQASVTPQMSTSRVELGVAFDNMPRGTRVSTKNPDGVAMDLSRGFQNVGY